MPIMLEVTRIVTFDAAHRLEQYDGKCHNLHGHTYKLEITVRGTPDGRGIVADFGELKAIYQEFYESLLDHRFLNESLAIGNTTAENMSIWFFDHWEAAVRPLHPELTPVRVRFWETPNSYCTLTYDDWRAGRADQ